MNRTEILEELGPEKFVGILRVGSVHLALEISDCPERLALHPGRETFIGLGNPLRTVPDDGTCHLNGCSTAKHGLHNAFPALDTARNSQVQFLH